MVRKLILILWNKLQYIFPNRTSSALKSFIDNHKDNGLKKTLNHYLKNLQASYADEPKAIIRPINTMEAEYMELQSKSKKKESLSMNDVQRLRDINSSIKDKSFRISKRKNEFESPPNLEKVSKYTEDSKKTMEEIKLCLDYKSPEKNEDSSDEYAIISDFDEKLQI